MRYVAQMLAKKVVIDGEGATKLIEVRITGAKDPKEARLRRQGIMSSSLVKTAVFGADPNFGRILSALGNSGADFKLDEVVLRLSDEETTVTLFETRFSHHDTGDPVRGGREKDPLRQEDHNAT